MLRILKFRLSVIARVFIFVTAVGMILYYGGWIRSHRDVSKKLKNILYAIPEAPYFIDDSPDPKDSAFKSDQRNIAGNNSVCVFPQLELYDPEIMKFFQVLPRVTCDAEADWVRIHQGMFFITESASKTHPNITCDAYPIVMENDFRTKELSPVKNIKSFVNVSNDFYRVQCSADDGASYRNFHAGIRYDRDVQRRKVKPGNGLGLDVIMLGLDSTSRQAWHRHLPKTSDYFFNVLNGTELEGYNILGDGTPAALMPILIGHREEELHEARRGYPDAKTVDDYPWIWNEFKKAGYATAWGEDDAAIGTFTYRLLGFEKPPVDHYYRCFSVAINPHYKEFSPDCIGSRPRHTVMYDYVAEMFYMYPQKRKWIFTFQSELSHKDNNKLSMMDEDVLEHMQRIEKEKMLDNAVFILMADHGGRFSKVRATAQGKLEERLPFFGFRFPPWFHKKHPEIIRNLKINAKRLTTPFDIHQTFHEIVSFTGTGKADITKRGVSLFKEIPEERNCDHANVDPHWCSCMDWAKVDLHSKDKGHIASLNRVLKVSLETFNNYTAPYRDICALLQIDKVVSMSTLKVKDAVLKFKDTSDGGRGRFGKMTDTTKHSKVLYQVTFFTHPGQGRFEVTVTHNLKANTYTLDSKDISRTNLYGDAPKCVEEKEPFLRPYCYCKNLIQT